MEGFDEYMKLITETQWDAEWLERADLIARGYGGIKAELQTSTIPIGTERASPSDYAYAWKAFMSNPSLLVNSGHFYTDYVLIILYAINNVYRKYAEDTDRYDAQFQTMLAEAEIFTKEYKEAHEAFTQAKHEVQVQSEYQERLQARAERALLDFRGSAEDLKKERWEWQHAIALGTRLLIDKGLVITNSKAKLIKMQKRRVKRTKEFEAVQRSEKHVSQQLRLHAIPDYRFVLEKVPAVLDAMKNEKGDDER